MSTAKNQLSKAIEAKEAGNASYKKGKWVEAIGHYTTASVLNATDPAPLLNRAQAYLKIEKWEDAARDCTSVLKIRGQEKNVKALFRRALAEKELGRVDAARSDLQSILSLEPSNAAAKEELQALPASPNDIVTPTPSKTPQPAATTKPNTRPPGKTIPIRLVERFSPLPPPPPQPPNKPSPTNAEAGPSTRPVPPQSFAALKASRAGNKKQFVDSNVPTTAQSTPPSQSVDGAATQQVAPVRRHPGSALEWNMAWDSRPDSDKWPLLRDVDTRLLCTMIDPLLEPDTLSSIYHVLHLASLSPSTQEDVTKARVNEVLGDLRGMRGWELLWSLMSAEEKGWKEEVEKWCSGH